ncbi:hypothetical protein [Treponema sp.]|uniref:hypothetical protein n=1 Tax=Treponema sp. TaxID=166 RepID=UPI00388E4913
MLHIRCCQYCEAPKRHVGCHVDCPEYLAEKQRMEELKQKIKIERLKRQMTEAYFSKRAAAAKEAAKERAKK